MKRLVGKGLITSIIGLLIIVFCGIMVYNEKQTVEAMSGWFALGVMFLRSKDSLIGIGDRDGF
jgi:hypothetical protein